MLNVGIKLCHSTLFHQQRTAMIDLLASSSLPHNMMPLLHHDHQYLFRLTSTFGWDDAISLCDYLVQVIESVVTSTDNNKSNEEDYCSADYFNDSIKKQPSTLEQWLRDAYNQLFYHDQWGNTPLHAASYVKPPVEVIDALFRLGRSLWEHGSGSSYNVQCPIWETQSKDGSTPFLVSFALD